MAWFIRSFICSNNHEWTDEWENLCNDRCPICDEETQIRDHTEVDLKGENKALDDAFTYDTGMVVHNYPVQSMSIPFIMLIRKDRTNEGD